MNYLGIDYGEQHIGIAFSGGALAEPLQTVARSKAISSIKSLIVKHRVDALVVGDCPENYLNQLSQLDLPVYLADETLSSYDAIRSLLHTSKSRRKNLEHAAAAAVILQNWLDFQAETQ